MEPAHLLEDEVSGATPAPQVELIDHHVDRPIEPPIGRSTNAANDRPVPRTVLDENGWREMRTGVAPSEPTSDDAEAPYLRMRSSIEGEGSGLRTPTPLLDDLTDLAIPMPEPPAIPPLPLVEITAGAHLDPADETGVTLLSLEPRRRRVSLSRPWFASLGVLAFSAGLLTAAAAGVIARPVRSAAAAGAQPVAANPVTPPAAASNVPAAPPAEATPAAAVVPPAEAPVAVATAEAPVAMAVPADAGQASATAPTRPLPSAKGGANGAGASKLRTRGNSAPTRGRARVPKSRREPHGESAMAQSASDGTAPSETREAAPAATAAPRHPADWVDPFVE